MRGAMRNPPGPGPRSYLSIRGGRGCPARARRSAARPAPAPWPPAWLRRAQRAAPGRAAPLPPAGAARARLRPPSAAARPAPRPPRRQPRGGGRRRGGGRQAGGGGYAGLAGAAAACGDTAPGAALTGTRGSARRGCGTAPRRRAGGCPPRLPPAARPACPLPAVRAGRCSQPAQPPAGRAVLRGLVSFRTSRLLLVVPLRCVSSCISHVHAADGLQRCVYFHGTRNNALWAAPRAAVLPPAAAGWHTTTRTETHASCSAFVCHVVPTTSWPCHPRPPTTLAATPPASERGAQQRWLRALLC